jgi:hypothetical protein
MVMKCLGGAGVVAVRVGNGLKVNRFVAPQPIAERMVRGDAKLITYKPSSRVAILLTIPILSSTKNTEDDRT